MCNIASKPALICVAVQLCAGPPRAESSGKQGLGNLPLSPQDRLDLHDGAGATSLSELRLTSAWKLGSRPHPSGKLQQANLCNKYLQHGKQACMDCLSSATAPCPPEPRSYQTLGTAD